jgi:hypothetical protein
MPVLSDDFRVEFTVKLGQKQGMEPSTTTEHVWFAPRRRRDDDFLTTSQSAQARRQTLNWTSAKFQFVLSSNHTFSQWEALQPRRQ